MQASLVKYNTPILISTSGPKGKKDKKAKDAQPAMTQTEDILNSILPPREWTQEDQLWVQYVSSTPATRADVINLQEDLDKWLQQRQARETGICPIREELYSQCFDELIRQVTINCPERGLLLLRVRDEIRMSIAAYQTLYQSSVTFGTRKQLQSEQGKAETEQMLAEQEEQKKQREAAVVELKNKCDAIERRENERRQVDERKRKEEIDFLKHQQQHLDAFMKSRDRKSVV